MQESKRISGIEQNGIYAIGDMLAAIGVDGTILGFLEGRTVRQIEIAHQRYSSFLSE